MNKKLQLLIDQASTTTTEYFDGRGNITSTSFDKEKFAKLVAAAEREACAKVCETLGVHPALNVYAGGPDWYKHGKECAAAIRARGKTK
jgi:hypothetical protein